MTTFNVSVPVVALVEAESADEAIAKLYKRILTLGLRPSDDQGDAFESEPDVSADF